MTVGIFEPFVRAVKAARAAARNCPDRDALLRRVELPVADRRTVFDYGDDTKTSDVLCVNAHGPNSVTLSGVAA